MPEWVYRVDRDGLLKHVEEGHYGGRVRDEVEGVVALDVGYGWVGIVGYQSLDDVQQAIPG